MRLWASGAWQDAQAGFLFGVWAGPWHELHGAWPGRTTFACAPWQLGQPFGEENAWVAWHVVQATLPAWKALSLAALAWQLVHATAAFATVAGAWGA